MDQVDFDKQYSDGRRDFTGCDLRGLRLQGEYHGLVMARSNLTDADFTGASLNECDLGDSKLCYARLIGMHASETNFARSDFSRVRLEGARLLDCCLLDVILEDASLCREEPSIAQPDVVLRRERAQLDEDSIKASRWAGAELRDWFRLGGDLDEGSADYIRQKVLGGQRGLTIFLDTQASRIDRFLIDAIIVQVLGPDTDCDVVEFRRRSDRDTALIRLNASSLQDLELVAQVLQRRAWQGPDGNLPMAPEGPSFLAPIRGVLASYLEGLTSRVSQMIIRWSSDGAPTTSQTWRLRGHLPQEQLDLVERIAIHTHVSDLSLRSMLMSGVEPERWKFFKTQSSPGSQVKSDLRALNRSRNKNELACWLRNAAELLSDRTEGKQLADMASQVDGEVVE